MAKRTKNIYKIMHRKLKIEDHDPYLKKGVNAGAPALDYRIN
jgi:hypothetical protein